MVSKKDTHPGWRVYAQSNDKRKALINDLAHIDFAASRILLCMACAGCLNMTDEAPRARQIDRHCGTHGIQKVCLRISSKLEMWISSVAGGVNILHINTFPYYLHNPNHRWSECMFGGRGIWFKNIDTYIARVSLSLICIYLRKYLNAAQTRDIFIFIRMSHLWQ